jgi:hypothetical protein
MKQLNPNDFTFTKEQNLFNQPVLAVYRNKDKKHIISIGKEHLPLMNMYGYNPEDHQQVLDFISRFYDDHVNPKPKTQAKPIQSTDKDQQNLF